MANLPCLRSPAPMIRNAKKLFADENPDGNRSGIGKWCGSAEVVESVFAAHPIVTVIHSYFITDVRR